MVLVDFGQGCVVGDFSLFWFVFVIDFSFDCYCVWFLF